MNKLQQAQPLGGAIAPRLVVKVERRARPPTPWTWAIHEEGRAEPFRCSARLYRSAEDAWAVGHAVLDRLPRSTGTPSTEDRPSVAPAVTAKASG